MKRLAQMQLRATLLLVISGTTFVFAQSKGKQTFEVNDDVSITINSSHVNFEFETWNKDRLEITPIIEGEDLTKEEEQKLLDAWDIVVNASRNDVTIEAHGGGLFEWDGLEALESLEGLNALESLEGLEALEELGPMMTEMIGPLLEGIAENPLPEGLMEGLEGMEFDYDAYEQDKEGYMKEWEAEMEERFGEDYEIKMEAWGEKFGEEYSEKMEAWGEEFGKKMEAWGEQFGKDFEKNFGKDFEEKMEAWGEQFGEEFGKDMEKWAEELEKKAEEWEAEYEENGGEGKTIIINGDGLFDSKGATRTIKIKMPKDAKLELNVRHGEVKLGSVYNLKADLDYTKFFATTIDGGETSINSSYAPLFVKNWLEGELFTNYVETCVIDSAQNITLNANSSNVTFGVIGKDAMLNGSYGFLVINNLGSSFGTVALDLENTDANIFLPAVDFDLYFNGKKSKLKAPSSMTLNTSGGQDRTFIKGFRGAKGSDRSININANYSEVTMH
ncbi:MAG: hypothetical protein ABJM06_04325 [Gilvibacter sp.]